MKKTYYLIKINNLYYGKENSINGRILIVNNQDIVSTMYIVEAIGYTTKKGAKKAMQKLINEYKKENKEIKELKLNGITIEK